MTEAATLPLRCHCGQLRGVLHDAGSTEVCRVICHCDDCQAFARSLARDDILDANGGTDILQLSPSRIRFIEGTEQIACRRLRAGGLLRWYARCCESPITNTPPAPKLPFTGLFASFVDVPSAARDEALRPVDHRIMTKFASPRPVTGVDSHERFPLRQMLRLVSLLLRWRLRGDQRRSPFFDAETWTPIAEPTVLGD